MSKQRVLVTHTAPLSFQASDNWKQILTTLSSLLPLTNLQWSNPSRPYVRTIQELHITLRQFDTLRDERTSQIPGTVLEKPMLNIYFVPCDDQDAYKSAVKRQIREWRASVTQRKQEWLIVHVDGSDARNTGGFFSMKSSILERIKADFNTDKRDRCTQLLWTGGQTNPSAWGDVVTKLKEGLLYAFDSAISHREEEVRRFEGQRQMPGWNFCTFFILKESIASSFEGVNLLDDALLQYDELEALFFQVLRDRTLSWFGTLISPSPRDDSAPLLDVDKKPYRDLILANTISVFDFRIYLLGRQCALLGRMGKVVEVAKKASAFLAAFGRRLRDEANVPDFFVESWTYSSALSVVERCDEWAAKAILEPTALCRINACKGELLELARNQLDIIGIKIGHLPSIAPFILAFPSVSVTLPPTPNTTLASRQAAATKISRLDLLASIENRSMFYELYVAVTNRAVDMYANGGRRRFALKLHGSLAALDVHRGRLEDALQTYTMLPAHYAPHMWTSLQSLMLSRALATHSDLNKPKDRDLIHLLLSFLSTHADSKCLELLKHEKEGDVEKLVGTLKEAALALDDDMQHDDHPAFSIKVTGDARLAQSQDGSFLDVTIINRLPCAVPIEEVCLTLGGRDTEKARFSANADGLPSGKTILTLFCSSSSFGTFVADSSGLRLGRLHFRYMQRKPPDTGRSVRSHKEFAMLVRIPRDYMALDVRVRQPYRIELGATSEIMVSVSTGRNSVSRATLKLSAPPGAQLQFGASTLERAGAADLEVTEDRLVLSNIINYETVSLVIPYSSASSFPALKIGVDVEYVTVAEPSVVRSLHVVRAVPTSFPVAVNVQDFFRGKKLLSKFTISAVTRQHIRISSVSLEKPKEGYDDLKIIACSPRTQPSAVTITSEQPTNFLFSVYSAEGPVSEPLRLVITYRTLREDVEALILQTAQEVLPGPLESSPQRGMLVSKLLEALEGDSTWIEMYELTGEVNVPDSHDKEAEDLAEAMVSVKQLLRAHRHSSPAFGEWREIKIPVDIPEMNVVASACIRILPPRSEKPKRVVTSPDFYAGQPLAAVVSIKTSFHWGPARTEKGKKYMMRYDIEEVLQVWLISGRKRGIFTATVRVVSLIAITMIALRHGELLLPKVAVEALPVGESEMTMVQKIVPSTETHQSRGAEKILILPH